MAIPSTRGGKKNVLFALKRLSMFRRLRSKIFFKITSSSLCLRILNKFGLYKRSSTANLNFEKSLLRKYPVVEEFLKPRKHSADIFSRYSLHFNLWYHIFFKQKDL